MNALLPLPANNVSSRWILIASATLVAVISGAVFFFTINVPSAPKAPLDHMRLGAENGLLASAVWIAERNGYFTEQGLNVEIVEFPSGRATFARMLKEGDLDMATVAQTPIVTNSFFRNDFRLIAGMVQSLNDVKIIVRKDSGILLPTHLKGKKIGVTHGSTGHYFLGLFLAQNGIKLRDVTIVDLEASLPASALHTGAVDAISTWEPNAYNARKLLGDKALQMESRGTFREDFYFAVPAQEAIEHPERLQRFLKAIDRASDFLVTHQDESRSIVAKRLHLDEAFVADVWDDYDFDLFLDQGIVLSLEYQARWMKENGIADGEIFGNYLTLFSFEALEAVKPEAVTIIR